MLNEVSSLSGNLLLNVGPNPDDGSIGKVETQRLLEAGKWLTQYDEGVYGHLDRVSEAGTTHELLGRISCGRKAAVR